MDEPLKAKLQALSDLTDSIDPLLGSLDLVQALRMIAETAESAQFNAVNQARREGASWDQLGRAMGTTRQAAQQRYGR